MTNNQMFKNILIPISSEFYSKAVLEQGAFLAAKFQSTITLIYIIEEKMLNQADKLSDTYRTSVERTETKKAIIKEHRHTADAIVFDDAKRYLTNRGVPLEEKVIKGEFSNVVKTELSTKNYDLVLMGFAKGCILNYRLLDEVHIPIWVVAESSDHSMLAVCSNLAPNQKVPTVSIKLSQVLGWNLHMVYVVDTQDNVEVDEQGLRSNKKPLRELIAKGQRFVQDMEQKGIDARVVTGSLEKATGKVAEGIGANLVIVGREQKKSSTLGLPVKSVKRKMAEQCRYSILFLN